MVRSPQALAVTVSGRRESWGSPWIVSQCYVSVWCLSEGM